MWRSVIHRTSVEMPSDDSTDRTIRQFSINWRNIAPTLKSHAMTQQAAHIVKTLHETTTIQPKQCSAFAEISNAHPTVSSDVLRERHLALSHLTDMTLPYDDSTDRTIQQSSLQQRRHNQSKATAGRTHVGTAVPSDFLHQSKAVDKSMSKHEGAIR